MPSSIATLPLIPQRSRLMMRQVEAGPEPGARQGVGLLGARAIGIDTFLRAGIQYNLAGKGAETARC